MFKKLIYKKNFFSLQIIILCLSFLLFLPSTAQGVNRKIEERKSLPWKVRITFGLRGPKPLIWDGKASINEGEIEAIQSINFTKKDKLFPEKFQWQCSIDRLRGRQIADELRGISPREYLEERIAKGIILDLHASRDARVSMATRGGVFSFCLADLALGNPLMRLEKNVKIELAPREFIFGDKKTRNNYSAVAIDSMDNIWAAWTKYKRGKERLVLKKYDGKKWGKEIEISGAGCYMQPSMAGDLEGGLWVCWSGRVKGNWDIYARYFKKGRGGKTICLSEHASPDTNQQIFIDRNNRLWLCWQSFQLGNADIFMKYYEQGRWSSIIKVTDHPGNDWQPDLTVDAQGNVSVAWDSYRGNKHVILLRQYTGRSLLPEIEVFSTDNYVAHASLASDEQGRVWIAWDESGGDWGFGEDEEERFIGVNKYEAVETEINYLKVPMEGRRGRYNSRKMKLVCYFKGKFYKPYEDFYDKLVATMKIYADLPHLEIDSSGRLWLFFHHYIGKIPFYIHDKLMEIWKVYGTYYNGRTWSSPIEFSHTTWRNIFASSICTNKQNGEIWVTFAGDKRRTGSREQAPASVCVAMLNMEKIAPHNVELLPWENQPKVVTRASYTEITPIPHKQYESNLSMEKYFLYWGTVHEQHDVRGRMAMDGFVVDAFKYALDDQQYDFLGVTDYAHRSTSWFSAENYSLWEARKAASVHSIQPDFLSFYAKGKSPYKRAAGHSLQKRPIPKGAPVITAVYVEDFTDESFVEALKKKRNYVATDWILLDFAIEGYPMGDKFEGTNPHPRMLAKVIGTDDLDQVDIIRNTKCVYSSKNIQGREADIIFVDMDLPSDKKDDYHYFIQVKQKNGGMAWTPPCCYHYTPTKLSKN